MGPRHSPSRTFRILVTTSWIPGGVTTWTHEFANHLADRGHDVTCVLVKLRWPLVRNPPPFRDVRYNVIWLQAQPLTFLSSVPRLLSAYLPRHRTEIVVSTEAEGINIPSGQRDSAFPPHAAVVHVPEPAYVDPKRLVLATLGLSKNLLSAPLWCTKGRQDLGQRMTLWHWQWVQYFGRKRLERAPIVVCVSRAQSNAVQHAWGISGAKIRVIYNGIDTREFRPMPVSDRGRECRLLFVGGSNPRKGVDILLDAFALVSKRYSGVSLDLVGGWDWSVQKEKASKLGISSQIRFLPYVVYDNMPAYYTQSYAFIAPSRGESFGRTVAEAMACGVPVISTQAGSIPEVVDDGVSGILVPRDDVKALAEAIIELLNHPRKANEMGREGRRRVEKYFAWDVVIPQWEELFEQLT